MKTPLPTVIQTEEDQAVEEFLEDLRGFVWNDFKVRRRNWDKLARDAKLSYSTVRNFAAGETRRPQFPTIQKLMRAMDLRFGIFRANTPWQKDEIFMRPYRRHAPPRPK